MTLKFPSADDLAEKMVERLTQGATKSIEDLPNQWMIKTLLLATRDVTYDAIVVAKSNYEDRDVYLAEEEALDRLCEEMTPDVRRKQAVSTILSVNLKKAYPATADIFVPTGSFVTSPKMGDIESMDFYLTQENVLSKDTSTIEVLVECEAPGIVGNLTTGSVIYPGMVGVDEAEIVGIVREGSDRETDASLRARLLESLEYKEKGGTEPDYEIWAKQVPGVITAKAIPLARGNGTLDLIIVGANGLPTETLINNVQQYIDSKAPAGGLSVIVRAPIPKYIDIQVNVTLENGTDIVSFTDKIRDALTLTIAVENDVLLVRKAKLGQAIGSLQGVFNYSIIAPIVDIRLDQGELAILGNLIVNEVA